jgi:hypothetical protein
MHRYIVEQYNAVHITLIGPMSEWRVVLEQLHMEGFQVTNQGPYTDERMFPECDVTRFKVSAIRKIRET